MKGKEEVSSKNKLVEVDFRKRTITNRMGVKTSIRGGMFKKILDDLITNLRKKRYEEKPGPNCPTNEEIRKYLLYCHNSSYNDGSLDLLEKHIFSCPRCYTLVFKIMGDVNTNSLKDDNLL